ncbi:ABC-type enterobactin transport system permease subunit [Microbacterium sp. SORGH_AS428]|nr:ABC-type enterobactin transport system permease subunit [Microbacterium sp. SORGH_AS_0428]
MTVTAGARDALTLVRAGRRRRRRRWIVVTSALAAIAIAVYALSLMLGQTFYSPAEVWAVLTGQRVPGASFTVGELRLPRATTALLTGLCFGMGGVVFQTMLRNPLASPDVIGISSGASAAAVTGIVVLGLGETSVSFLATGAALAAALLIYLLAYKRGGSGARLILIGIGVAAICNSVVSYIISRARGVGSSDGHALDHGKPQRRELGEGPATRGDHGGGRSRAAVPVPRSRTPAGR